MRSILILSLLVLSLFPACKRNNEYTQSSTVSTKHQAKQAEALSNDVCEPVDCSNLYKGIACIALAPVTAAAGVFIPVLIALPFAFTVKFIVPMWILPLPVYCLVAAIFVTAMVGAVVLLCKGCSYLVQHARAVKARERARCKVCKKIHKKEEIALAS